MIALFDFVPEFCPHCGTAFKLTAYNRDDYNAGASCECRSCHLSYARVGRPEMLRAATDSGSDLARYE